MNKTYRIKKGPNNNIPTIIYSSYNGFKLKFILKGSEKSKHNIGQFTKEPPLNALNGLYSLKWIQFNELKNIDYFAEYKIYSVEWIGAQIQQYEKGSEIKVILINLDKNILSTIKNIHLECHDQFSIHNILDISRNQQDEHYLSIIKMTSRLLTEKLKWNDQAQQWKRKGKMKVALKILHNSCGKFDEFLQEV
ncbi:24073_t:CDS:2 [Cetraspora pellucida]|uniref:24073_t:CDS:1 n=1 Tax=Cetraspora pellucida TaxID=1433469 RepID=A0A9N9HS37_9GLOM|nr:24073_t:CDS:2 [Cetraspora pellucida]